MRHEHIHLSPWRADHLIVYFIKFILYCVLLLLVFGNGKETAPEPGLDWLGLALRQGYWEKIQDRRFRTFGAKEKRKTRVKKTGDVYILLVGRREGEEKNWEDEL